MSPIPSILRACALCGIALITLCVSTFAADFDTQAAAPPMVNVTQSSASGALLSFEFNQLVRQEIWSEGERFERFPVEGEPVAGPVGLPELPSMVRYVLIPPQCGVDIRIKNLSSHIVSDVNPFPRQPLEDESALSTTFIAAPQATPLVRDADFSSHSGFWPEEVVKLESPQIMRGYRIVPIVFFPVRYNPGTRELEVVDELEIELDYTSERNRVNLVENPEKPRYSRHIRKVVEDMVINPPMRDDGVGSLRDPIGSIVYVMGPAGNLWNPVLETLNPLLEWRRKMGWTVQVLRVQDMSSGGIRGALVNLYRQSEYPPDHVVICGDGGQGQFIAGFFDKRGQAGNPYESDHEFGCLEGDDLLPEATVGRFLFDSIDMLRGMVTKVITYETDPFIGEGAAAGWQNRAAFAAVDSRSGVTSIDLCRWGIKLTARYGYNRFGELYWTQNQPQPSCAQYIPEQINSGISLYLHRGWTNMNQFTWGQVNQLNNRRMLPLVLLVTCNTNDFSETVWGDQYNYADRFFHHAGGGAIGCLGSGGATHTAYNNLIASGTLQSLYVDTAQTQGWACTNGRMELKEHYEGRGDIEHPSTRDQAWRTELFIFNLIGDPATSLFTAVPRRLTVTAPEDLRIGETHIAVNVVHTDDESPATEATVCLYKAGEFQLVGKPDADGNIAFDLDPAWSEDGDIKLTITGHNLFPALRAYGLEESDLIGAGGVAIDDDGEGNSEGNGDGEANQTETIELTVELTNYSDEVPDGQVTATLTTTNPLLEIIQGDAQLDAAPEAGESAEVSFIVRIGDGFPSGERASFNLTTRIGDVEWASSVSLPVAGPEFEFVSFQWVDEPLGRGERAEVNITVRNIGETGSVAFTGRLFSLMRTAGPEVVDAEFEAIDAGATGRSRSAYRLSATPFHFGGKPVELGMAILAENGFRDTLYFEIPVRPAVRNEPFGADNYGYYCFDDFDTTWFVVPEYDWVEIDPRQDGDGDALNLPDRGESQDVSVGVDLPFVFQYYGEEFDEITVCSNGWLAMGRQTPLFSSRNRIMPGPECVSGMIAPFWDDLIVPQNVGGIYTWYDQEENRFIIEWSGVKRLGPRINGQGVNIEAMETFQVHLYDPAHWPSFTGDGDIEFHYLDVADEQSCYQTWDTPFASVGIVSPDLSTGLGYIYWHRPTPGADTLRDGRAIKFTTLVDFRMGAMTGRVTDAATGEPVDSVDIFATYGFHGMTDENGDFRIEDVLVDSNYTVTASKRFYNDSVIPDVIVLEGEETYVEFVLLHPEFGLSADSVAFIMLVDSVANSSIELQNTGNGVLWFNSRYDYSLEQERVLRGSGGDLPGRDDPDNRWDVLRRWNIADSTGNAKLQSVVFLGDRWLVAGGRADQQSPHMFYTLDREGNVTGQFEQSRYVRVDSLGNESQWVIGGLTGIRDLQYFNGQLLAVANDTAVYQLDPESGAVIDYWAAPDGLNNVKCLTRNPTTGSFYLAGITTNIWEVNFLGDHQMETVQMWRNADIVDPRNEGGTLRKSGFAWFPDDPDGYYLYVLTTNEAPPDPNQTHPDAALFKINPATQEIIFLTEFTGIIETLTGGTRGGMSITPKWSTSVYALVTILDNGTHDWMGIFELAVNSSWISYEPKSDTLEAGEPISIDLEIRSADLDMGEYEIILDYTHNAFPGGHRIPITLVVTDTLPEEPDTGEVVINDPTIVPFVFELQAAYPNPFNSATTIRFGIEALGPTRMRIYDLAGREVATLVDEPLKPGRYMASFKGTELASGVYVCRLESGGKRAVQKLVMMK